MKFTLLCFFRAIKNPPRERGVFPNFNQYTKSSLEGTVSQVSPFQHLDFVEMFSSFPESSSRETPDPDKGFKLYFEPNMKTEMSALCPSNSPELREMPISSNSVERRFARCEGLCMKSSTSS